MIYNINFLNESISRQQPINEIKTFIDDIHVVNENALYIKNLDSFVTPSMVESCYGNTELIEQACLLEGAKFDLLLKNFLKEGKDYRGIKGLLKEIAEETNKDKEQIKLEGKSGGRKFLHLCKRALQILEDIGFAISIPLGGINIASKAAGVAASNALANGISASLGMGKAVGTGAAVGGVAGAVVFGLITLIVGLLINRAVRFGADYLEFNQVKEDANKVISDLEDIKSKATDKKEIERIDANIEKIKTALSKAESDNELVQK